MLPPPSLSQPSMCARPRLRMCGSDLPKGDWRSFCTIKCSSAAAAPSPACRQHAQSLRHGGVAGWLAACRGDSATYDARLRQDRTLAGR
jgi:hypothetical protein